jgi:2-iminobutanoate/2-iminopropanoate deaminase
METITHDPTDGIYTTGDWAHAIEIRNPGRIMYLAGTMGLDADSQPGSTLDEQLDLVWSNIRRILAEADMTVDNIVRVTSYLRDVTYAEANGRARVAALAGRIVPTTAIVVETLSPDWLVELEVIAAA